jgi:lipoprotein-anchoring transpeptidase ErfK/SrfK
MSKLVNAVAFGSMWLLGAQLPAMAQGWPSWADDAFGRSGYYYGPPRQGPWSDRYQRDWDEDERARPEDRRPHPRIGGDIRDGGARPTIAPQPPPVVAFPYAYPANSIVIDTGARKLYYVLENNRAYQYAISVGREGFNWTGTEAISRKQEWPDWYPPAEMRERDPSLPEKMTGGVKNPLGAMALYLGKTLYRIHGTNDVKSIGRAESSGCFRMLNSAVIHLASITEIGTSVTVVPSVAASQVSQSNDKPPQQSGPQRVEQAPPAEPQPVAKSN